MVTNVSPDRYNSPIVRQKLKQNPRIYILYKVVTNILYIMERRGYIIPDVYNYDNLKHMTPNEFIRFFHDKVNEHNNYHPEDKMTILEYLSRDFECVKPNINNCKTIRVIFPGTPEIPKTTTKTQIDMIVNDLGLILNSHTKTSILQAMIVSELPLSPQARTSLGGHSAINYELYTYKEISFLASHHFLVPEYRVLTGNEIDEMVKRNIKITTLKTIAINDPIVREYGFSVNDVLEITRRNYLYLHPIIVTTEYRVVSIKLMVPKK